MQPVFLLLCLSSALLSHIVLYPNSEQCFYLATNFDSVNLKVGDVVKINYSLESHRGGIGGSSTTIEFKIHNDKNVTVYDSNLEGTGSFNMTIEDAGVYMYCANVVRSSIRSRGIRGAVDADFSIEIHGKKAKPGTSEDKTLENIAPLVKRINNRTQFIHKSQTEADKAELNVDAADYRNYKRIPYLAILDVLIYSAATALVTFQILKFFKLKKVA